LYYFPTVLSRCSTIQVQLFKFATLFGKYSYYLVRSKHQPYSTKHQRYIQSWARCIVVRMLVLVVQPLSLECCLRWYRHP